MKIWSPIILAVGTLVAVPTLCLGITATDLEKAKEAVKQEKSEATEQEFNEIKADPKRFREFVSVTQAALGALGYGTGPFHGDLDQKTVSAIRHYQAARQLKQTGDLDPHTFQMIVEDAEELHRSFPYLPSLHVFSELWNDGYMRATGTWILEGGNSRLNYRT